MKKQFQHGFWAGLLTAGLLLALGLTVLAAGRTISIDDGIRITFNGAAFTPKDANGKPVELFTYNGTTYAPLRAICEAAGLKVGYDSATRTAQVSTPSATPTPATPAPATPTPTATAPAAGSEYISIEKAKELALAHAGVKAADAVFLQVELDWEDGRAEYEVEFYAGNTEYDYDLDAVTGAVLSFDHDIEGWQFSPSGTGGIITAERAQELATNYAFSQGIQTIAVIECKLDRENGRQVYELELRSGYTEYDCEIEAATGTILSWEAD